MTYALLQKTSLPAEIFKKAAEKETGEIDFSRIRCPHCKWQPKKSSRWYCSDCDYPEFFYNACFTFWNTFETRGVCPVCRHRWRFTSCLRCQVWALHEDWYAEAKD